MSDEKTKLEEAVRRLKAWQEEMKRLAGGTPGKEEEKEEEETATPE